MTRVLSCFRSVFDHVRTSRLLSVQKRELLPICFRDFSTKPFNEGDSSREVLRFLKTMKSNKRTIPGSNRTEIQICMLCDKGNRSNEDNLWKLSVYDSGGFLCFRCGTKGTFEDLKKRYKINSGDVDYRRPALNATKSSPSRKIGKPVVAEGEVNYVLPRQSHVNSFHTTLFPSYEASKEEMKVVRGAKQLQKDRTEVLKYLLENRGLTPDVLKKYSVGMAQQQFIDEKSEVGR